MAFNGSGTFERIHNWVGDRAGGTKIVAARHDAEDDGFAAGLSNCITKDGQTTIAQNIPFNSKKITGLAAATASTDAANLSNITAITDLIQTDLDAAEVDIDDLETDMATAQSDITTAKTERGVQRSTLTEHKKLKIANDATNANYQLDITADAITLYGGANGVKDYTSFSQTVDITVSGAGGLDTGSEANSTWYYIWAISKADDTKSVILSLSATAPTMPTDYIFKGLIGAIYNNSSGNFISISQIDRDVMTVETRLINDGRATSYTAVDCSNYMPPNARKYHGSLGIRDVSASAASMEFAATSAGLGEVARLIRYSGTSGEWAPVRMPVVETQTVYYRSGASDQGSYVDISGWGF